MGTLSLFPLSLSIPLNSLSQPLLYNPLFQPQISTNTLKPTRFGNKILLPRSNPRDPKESIFLDENGVVDDMDGYLNYLSLEYDSVWDTKPSWCQPWTIVLTGISVTACSWLILHSVAVTAVIFLLICTWWYIFLYSYPKAYSDMIAERRKKVTNGVEDTFGLRKRRVNDLN